MSPLLANIYLDSLDKYMESRVLEPLYVATEANEEHKDTVTTSTSDMPMILLCYVMEQRQKPSP